MIRKGKLEDLLSAFFEQGNQAVLESEFAKDATIELGKHVVGEATAIAIGSAFAAISPRLNGIRLNYKEKQFERNIKKAISVLNNKIEELDFKYSLLSEELQEKFRGIYVEWILDNLYNERQIEKIPCQITGYINMMEVDTTDDIMLIFIETLNQLTMLDIDVLKIYSRDYNENWQSVCDKRGISYEQLDMVKAKLERHGLLYSNNDDQRDSNIDIVADYIGKRVKEESKRNGSPEKVKLGRIKKIQKSESYSITKLGRDFLKKIE